MGRVMNPADQAPWDSPVHTHLPWPLFHNLYLFVDQEEGP